MCELSKNFHLFQPKHTGDSKRKSQPTFECAFSSFSERYLGLPTAVGRVTSGTFKHIGDRAKGKMQGWSERFFACVGRETLIKLIVQAIPTFSMSCFLLTKKV